MIGRVHIAFDNTPQILPHIRAGGVKSLAVTTRERSRFTPELPTMIEAGVPDFEISSWFGVTAPRATPRPIVERLTTILQQHVQNPAMIETLSTLSAEPLPIFGAEFAQFMAGQRERFGGIIRRLGITAVVAVFCDSSDAAPNELHHPAGFAQTGHIKAAGWRRYRWADSCLMQRPLGNGAGAPPKISMKAMG
jgi:hypothetical protein